MASVPENDKKPQWKPLVKDLDGDKLVKVSVNLVGEDCASLAVQPREGGDATSGSGRPERRGAGVRGRRYRKSGKKVPLKARYLTRRRWWVRQEA
jgi:hypothetical protein